MKHNQNCPRERKWMTSIESKDTGQIIDVCLICGEAEIVRPARATTPKGIDGVGLGASRKPKA